MKTDFNIRDLFEEIFNSNVFDLNDLWNKLLDDRFSQDELEYLKKMKNEKYFELIGISEDTLLNVFKDYYHREGFFDFQFDNLEEGWRYATVELFYNDQLDVGYVYAWDEIIPYQGFSSGEKIYEDKIS